MVVVESGLGIVVLTREPQVEGKHAQPRRVLIRQIRPKRIAVPTPHQIRRTAARNGARRVQMIGVDVENAESTRFRPDTGNRRIPHPDDLLDRIARSIVLTDQMPAFVVHEKVVPLAVDFRIR
jgi:hypothetical protein